MASKTPKTRCSGEWTEARFRSFITSLLRKGTFKWRPKSEAKLRARHHEKLEGKTKRLVFHSVCAGCGELYPESTCAVDHIQPVVDPAVGFTTWDDFINRLFCEIDNLQVLCTECHDTKTKEERSRR